MVGWFIIFGLCSAFGNMSVYRGMFDCRSRGREFYSGLVTNESESSFFECNNISGL